MLAATAQNLRRMAGDCFHQGWKQQRWRSEIAEDRVATSKTTPSATNPLSLNARGDIDSTKVAFFQHHWPIPVVRLGRVRAFRRPGADTRPRLVACVRSSCACDANRMVMSLPIGGTHA